MKNHFKNAISLINQAAYPAISARLEKELQALESDNYKIAVTGEFKAGKSTLINRIFLKEDALFTDIMEATAVPVEICYGTDKRLEIYPYKNAGEKDLFNADDDLVITQGEGRPIEILNPSSDDIKACTSAETPEGRAILAEKTARVKLYWPANNLEGLTVFDTPGINSINSAVIATTYRIIPEADLVLFVSGTRQLSNVEIEFLSSRVFTQGITRLMSVITYDPESRELSETAVENLIKSIQSQLRNTGRDNIPVKIFNIRDTLENAEESKSFKNQVEMEIIPFLKENGDKIVSSVISDLLGEKKSLSAKAETLKPESSSTGIAALEKALINFIRDNVRPGRMEKAAQVLKNQIQLALVRCSAELSAMNKSEAERLQMLSDIKVREAETRLKYEKLSMEFQGELRDIQQSFTMSCEQELEGTAQKYTAGFDSCEGLGEIQSLLKNIQQTLKRDMEDIFLSASRQAGEEIRGLIEKYGVKSQIILNPWQSEISRELNIDGGIMSRVPPFAVLALDIMLFVRFGPFGPLADILIRLLANYIPFLNKALPVSLAAAVLKGRIKISLHNQFKSIKAGLPEQVNIVFNDIIQKLLSQWNIYADEQLNAVRKSVEKIVEMPVNNEHQAVIKEIKAKLEIMLVQVR